MNTQNSGEGPSRPRLAWVLAAICLAATLVLPRAASACSCYPTPPHEAVRIGPYVFSGTVIKVTTATRSDGDHQITEFQIDKSWRGDASGTVTFEGQNKTTCDVAFREGEHYITSAARTSHGTFETSICGMFPGASDDDILTLLDTYPVKVAALDRAIAKNPADPEPYRRKVSFLLDYGDLIAAIAALGELIAVVPHDPQPLIDRGKTELELSRIEAAREDFATALRIVPNSPTARRGIEAAERLLKIDDPTFNDKYEAWPDLYPDLYSSANYNIDAELGRDRMCREEDVSWWVGEADAFFGSDQAGKKKLLENLVRFFTNQYYGCTANVRRLLDAGVDPNIDTLSIGNYRIPILLEACGIGYPDIVIALLEHGADPNVSDKKQGYSLTRCLDIANLDKYERVLELALEKGLDPNSDEYLASRIVKEGHADALRHMLAHGLNPNMRVHDSFETTMLVKVAMEAGYDEIVQILRAAGAKE